MSEAIAFDTHRFVKRLTQTGFTETQAEALADEQVRLLNTNLATKENLLQLEGRLRERMVKLKGDMEWQMAELKADLLKWMIGAMIAQTGVIVGLIFGFMKLFMGT
ncbi:MAG: DUF1640 domain-containing protein [Gammaproteobacteria bacterium]|nr:DUF1640 domain-containing protein [Gammaproteobacteria bacterium]MCY4283475.1 DUF1640 domain-containing protein [Gammaproteobacteria bacterium]MCY4337254.1 DUF1640 domain-containing protein [Gammaproteobacteria bacterium]